MKEFKFGDNPDTANNNTYFMPESWKEVTYAQYVDMLKTYQDTELGDIGKAAKLVSIASHIPMNLINEAGYDSVNKLFGYLGFINTEIKPEPIAHVTINNTTYYAQDLYKTDEISAYDTIQTQFQDNSLEKAPYILAILLRKALVTGEKSPKKSLLSRFFGTKTVEKEPELAYESFSDIKKDLEKRAILFKNQLNPIQVKSLDAFFLSNGLLSPLLIQLYSENQSTVQQLKLSLEAISDLNMDGKPLLQIWLKTISLKLGKYLIWKLTKS